MKGFYEMQIVVGAAARGITINAQLNSADDVAEFVAMFNEAQAQVFPASAEEDEEPAKGEDA